jgi:hypothetical protein
VIAWGIRFASVVASVLVAASASAQDGSETLVQRTPENAQKFVAGVVNRGDSVARLLALKVANGRFAQMAWNEQSATATPGTGAIASWTIVDRCHSRIDLKDVRALDYSGEFASVQPQDLQYEIDWSKVTTGDASNGTTIDVSLASGPPTSGYYFFVGLYQTARYLPDLMFLDGSEAKRVAFALEFLRSACAEKNDTGF